LRQLGRTWEEGSVGGESRSATHIYSASFGVSALCEIHMPTSFDLTVGKNDLY
jgi:hypothetical protein